jgi:succinyl-diaminopimelate desuccinylase
MLKKAVKDVYGVEARPMGIGGSTVAAPFRAAGYPAVVWSKVNSTAHQANESCEVPNMVGDAKVYAHLFTQQLP